MSYILREKRKNRWIVFTLLSIMIIMNYIITLPENMVTQINTSIIPKMSDIVEGNEDTTDLDNMEQFINLFSTNEYKYEMVINKASMYKIYSITKLMSLCIEDEKSAERYETVKSSMEEYSMQMKKFNGMISTDVGVNRVITNTIKSELSELINIVDSVLENNGITQEAIDYTESFMKQEITEIESLGSIVNKSKKLHNIKIILMILVVYTGYIAVNGTRSERKEEKDEIRRTFNELRKIKTGFYDMEEKLLDLYKMNAKDSENENGHTE